MEDQFEKVQPAVLSQRGHSPKEEGVPLDSPMVKASQANVETLQRNKGDIPESWETLWKEFRDSTADLRSLRRLGEKSKVRYHRSI